MTARAHESTVRRRGLAATRLLPAACAAVLCSIGIRWGTPDLQEEALPLRKAFEMWGWAGEGLQIDPQTAGWPALSFYVHLVLQHVHYAAGRLLGAFQDPGDYFVQYVMDPTAMIVLGRTLGVLAAAGTVWIVTRRGSDLGGTAGGLLAGFTLAASPLLVDQAHLITPDILMTLLAALAVSRLLSLAQRGHWHDAAWAGVWAGLGMATKYTPGLLMAALAAIVLVRRRQEQQPVLTGVLGDRRLWAAAAACAGAFVLTSPFTVLNLEILKRDVGYQLTHVSEGHFGHAGLGSGYLHYLRGVLGPGMGWPALLVAIAGALAALRRGTPGWVPLLSFLAFYLTLGGLRTQFDRYMLPALPGLALGIAAAWGTVSPRLGSSPWQRAALLVAAAILTLPPLVASSRSLERRLAPTTLQLAKSWLEENIDPGTEFVAKESYTPVFARDPRTEETSRQVLGQLNERQRQRLLDMGFVSFVELPLYSTRAELTAPYYDLRHFEPYRYIVTSGAVRRRYEAEPERFEQQLRFYDQLEQHGTLVQEFRASTENPGPSLWIHRMDTTAWENLRAEEGTLDVQWPEPWEGSLHPEHFRRFVETVAFDAFAQQVWWAADVYYSILYRITEASGRPPLEFRLAYAKLQTEQHAEAEALYRRLVVRSPDDPVINGNLGLLAQIRGDRDEAIRYYRHAIAVDSVGEIARWAREQLTELELDPQPDD